MPSRIERVTFTGGTGAELAARLDLPAGPPRAFAMFAHCFTCSKELRAASRLAAVLTDLGYGLLRFDFTGLGASEGEFVNTDFSSNVDDLVAAAAWLRDNHRAPQLLVGHSLGGTAVIRAAGRLPEVRAVATIGAPSDAGHVARLFDGAFDRAGRAADGDVDVELGGRTFTIRRELVDDLRTGSSPTTPPRWTPPCWCSTRRSTTSSVSSTPPRSTGQRATRRASSRSTAPTTC